MTSFGSTGIPKVIRDAHFVLERLKLFAAKAKKPSKRELAQDAVVTIENLIEHAKGEYKRGYDYGKAVGAQDAAFAHSRGPDFDGKWTVTAVKEKT